MSDWNEMIYGTSTPFAPENRYPERRPTVYVITPEQTERIRREQEEAKRAQADREARKAAERRRSLSRSLDQINITNVPAVSDNTDITGEAALKRKGLWRGSPGVFYRATNPAPALIAGGALGATLAVPGAPAAVAKLATMGMASVMADDVARRTIGSDKVDAIYNDYMLPLTMAAPALQPSVQAAGNYATAVRNMLGTKIATAAENIARNQALRAEGFTPVKGTHGNVWVGNGLPSAQPQLAPTKVPASATVPAALPGPYVTPPADVSYNNILNILGASNARLNAALTPANVSMVVADIKAALDSGKYALGYSLNATTVPVGEPFTPNTGTRGQHQGNGFYQTPPIDPYLPTRTYAFWFDRDKGRSSIGLNLVKSDGTWGVAATHAPVYRNTLLYNLRSLGLPEPDFPTTIHTIPEELANKYYNLSQKVAQAEDLSTRITNRYKDALELHTPEQLENSYDGTGIVGIVSPAINNYPDNPDKYADKYADIYEIYQNAYKNNPRFKKAMDLVFNSPDMSSTSSYLNGVWGRHRKYNIEYDKSSGGASIVQRIHTPKSVRGYEFVSTWRHKLPKDVTAVLNDIFARDKAKLYPVMQRNQRIVETWGKHIDRITDILLNRLDALAPVEREYQHHKRLTEGLIPDSSRPNVVYPSNYNNPSYVTLPENTIPIARVDVPHTFIKPHHYPAPTETAMYKPLIDKLVNGFYRFPFGIDLSDGKSPAVLEGISGKKHPLTYPVIREMERQHLIKDPKAFIKFSLSDLLKKAVQ